MNSQLFMFAYFLPQKVQFKVKKYLKNSQFQWGRYNVQKVYLFIYFAHENLKKKLSSKVGYFSRIEEIYLYCPDCPNLQICSITLAVLSISGFYTTIICKGGLILEVIFNLLLPSKNVRNHFPSTFNFRLKSYGTVILHI